MKKLILFLCALVCANAQLNRTTADYIQQGDLDTITDAGGDDTYSGCPLVSIAAYKSGMVIKLIPSTANTGAATINVCGLGAKDIKTAGGADPATGDVIASQTNQLMYDGTRFKLPAGGAVTAASLDAIAAPGADGYITPTVNGSVVEFPWDKTPLLAEAMAWTGSHTFDLLRTAVTTSTPGVDADCDASGEAGRLKVKTNGTSGQQFYVCEGTAGWKLSGDGGAVAASGSWPFGRPATALSSAPGTGSTKFAAFYNLTPMTINRISFYIVTAAASGTTGISMGIYDSSCNLIQATETKIGLNTTNTANGLAFSPVLVLPAGLYFWGVVTDDATMTLASDQAGTQHSALANENYSASTYLNFSGSAGTGSGATLAVPASCGTRTNAAVSVYKILFK